MKNLQIVFTAVNQAELLESEVQSPSEGQVLVCLERSTISSGTERAKIVGEANVSASGMSNADFPRYAGYSSSGIVYETGKGVKSVKNGDKVALSWSQHSKYICLQEKNVHLIPSEKISFAAGALCHIATFPLAAIRKCAVEFGESAIVMGQGVLGQIAVKLLRVVGAMPIIAADPIFDKQKKACIYGADYSLNPNDIDFSQKVHEITGSGANVAIEVTGVGRALDEVLDCMAKFGRVALLGCTRNSDFTIDYYHKVHAPGISLIGAHTNARPIFESSHGLWTTHDDAMSILRMISGGRLELDSLVEEVHVPTEAPMVYKRLVEEKGFPVVQFDWNSLNI